MIQLRRTDGGPIRNTRRVRDGTTKVGPLSLCCHLFPAEADAADKAYWLSRSPHERLRCVEILRRMNYGARATARLQRVLEFAAREPSSD
jgi:hypothetical protein